MTGLSSGIESRAKETVVAGPSVIPSISMKLTSVNLRKSVKGRFDPSRSAFCPITTMRSPSMSGKFQITHSNMGLPRIGIKGLVVSMPTFLNRDPKPAAGITNVIGFMLEPYRRAN
jgi:hypothetical protein